HVCANWLIGQQIVEAEQGGATRAGYGQAVLKSLAERLSAEFGGGFSLTALKHMRSFYQAYPDLLVKGHAVSDLLLDLGAADGRSSTPKKGHALRDLSVPATEPEPTTAVVGWRPGLLHGALAWPHYRAL